MEEWEKVAHPHGKSLEKRGIQNLRQMNVKGESGNAQDEI